MKFTAASTAAVAILALSDLAVAKNGVGVGKRWMGSLSAHAARSIAERQLQVGGLTLGGEGGGSKSSPFLPLSLEDL
ncbi:hypothetical protein DM02DRAFT_676032 [Periconia macrospinosa]|uniref:Uncharacterized protein n=1 Tax=Periconia macrospinosa TaxID=97972 RepID=A0A2V1DBX3_9PLEO|nr:hypothetical protein DM02DRAFT_676032 [Periconia macrospinosa]